MQLDVTNLSKLQYRDYLYKTQSLCYLTKLSFKFLIATHYTHHDNVTLLRLHSSCSFSQTPGCLWDTGSRYDAESCRLPLSALTAVLGHQQIG